MGTRGLIGFYSEQKDKLTYNHFDSYPEGVGVQILNEITKALEDIGIEKIRERVRKIKMVEDSETKPPKEVVEQYEKEYGNPGVGGPMDNTEIKTWYQLLRNAQGTLEPYMLGKIKHMIDSKDFIADSLFCEWVYIINLDDEQLEVYQGFQRTAHNDGRYARMNAREAAGGDTYYPCKLIKTYKFDDLPMDEDFTKELNKIAGYDEDE